MLKGFLNLRWGEVEILPSPAIRNIVVGPIMLLSSKTLKTKINTAAAASHPRSLSIGTTSTTRRTLVWNGSAWVPLQHQLLNDLNRFLSLGPSRPNREPVIRTTRSAWEAACDWYSQRVELEDQRCLSRRRIRDSDSN